MRRGPSSWRLVRWLVPAGIRLRFFGRSGELGRDADSVTPAPSDTDTSCSVSATVRSVCAAMFWCREVLRSRKVSTIAPIIATRRIRPAVWNRKM